MFEVFSLLNTLLAATSESLTVTNTLARILMSVAIISLRLTTRPRGGMKFAFKYPHKYKLCGWKVISVERGGQAIGPPRPIRLSGKFLSIQLRIRRAKERE
jgi:hypothetical protein